MILILRLRKGRAWYRDVCRVGLFATGRKKTNKLYLDFSFLVGRHVLPFFEFPHIIETGGSVLQQRLEAYILSLASHHHL